MQLHWDGNNTSVEERNRKRGLRHRRDTADPRPSVAREDRGVAARAREAAAVPAARRRCARRARRADLPCLLRRVPRAERNRLQRALRRQGDADPCDRYRPPPPRLVHARPRGQPEPALRRVPGRAVPALPEDGRLREPAARRTLAARALPAQRLRPTLRDLLEPAALRPRRSTAATTSSIPCASVSLRTWPRRTGAGTSSSTRACRATATSATRVVRTGPSWIRPTRTPSSST